MFKKIDLKPLVTALLLLLMFSGVALASTADQILPSLAESGSQGGLNPNAQGKPATEFPQAFANYASGLAGILSGLFMILVIYGGWLWMTAKGNEDQVMKAKNMILGAVIGITIVIAARIIAELVIYYLGTTLP